MIQLSLLERCAIAVGLRPYCFAVSRNLKCALLALLALAPQSVEAQVVDLPLPSGPYAVGTVVFDITDGAREEVWTETTGDARRLVVQLWHPTEATDLWVPAPYVLRQEALKPSLHKFWSDIPLVRGHARLDVGLPSGKTKFPLLVFSHGMNSAGFFYTALLQDLASHGYIVAAIDHSYWTIGEAFEDGGTIDFHDSMIARDKLSSDDIDLMMREGIIVMAADQGFVARKLLDGEVPAGVAAIADRIDSGRIGVFGHSMGGMAAQRACLYSVYFRSCLSLDGAVWNPVHIGTLPTASQKPLLLLLSEQFFTPNPDFAAAYMRLWKTPTALLLRDAKHNSFTDFPFLDPPTSESATPLPSYQRVRRVVREFFDAMSGDSGRRDLRDVKSIEGISVIDLRAIGTGE